jgi:colanic acid biosynthesis glycosyl transferase WcaI
MAVGMMRHGLAFRIGRLLERLVYRLTDHILVISEGFREKVLEQGAPPEKVQRISDWVDLAAIRPSPPVPELRRLMGAGPADVLVLHAGNMGEKQGLDNALEAAGLLEGALPCRLTLMGDGMDRPRLEAMVAARRFSNVGFLPLQPASMFPDLLASADVLLLNQRAQVVDSVAPSKLLSYLASGRPVVAAVNASSEAARLIHDAGAGLIVPPEQPAALADAFRTLAAAPERRTAMGVQGRRYVEQHYARDAVLAVGTA